MKLTPRLELINLLQSAETALNMATGYLPALAWHQKTESMIRNKAQEIRHYFETHPQLKLELFRALNPGDVRVQQIVDRRLHELREKMLTQKKVSKQRRPTPWSGLR